MEPLVKIDSDFKLQTIFAKSSISDVSQVLSSPLTVINQIFLTDKNQLYHGFLEQLLLLPSRDFTCSKLTIETLKTLKQDGKCV